jgi:hypothetical protein
MRGVLGQRIVKARCVRDRTDSRILGEQVRSLAVRVHLCTFYNCIFYLREQTILIPRVRCAPFEICGRRLRLHKRSGASTTKATVGRSVRKICFKGEGEVKVVAAGVDERSEGGI